MRALETKFSRGSRLDTGPVLYIGFSQGAILGATLLIRRRGTISARHPWSRATGPGALNPPAHSPRRQQRVLFACGRRRASSAPARRPPSLRAGVAVKVVYAPDQGPLRRQRCRSRSPTAVRLGDGRRFSAPSNAAPSNREKSSEAELCRGEISKRPGPRAQSA